nr:TraB domain-containing protein [Tanacetum cinerariifolium]
MASNKAIEYAPQCGDLAIESVTFHSNNFVGNFNYPQSASAYKEICKFLMNCPFAEDFTKIPSVLYHNFFRDSSVLTRGPEASGTLPQKRNKPLSKKTTPKATITSPVENVPTKDSDQTQSVSWGQTAHPQDTKRNIQLVVKGSHSPLGDGSGKSQPLSESKKDSSTPSIIALSGTDAKYHVDQTQSTRFKKRMTSKKKVIMMSLRLKKKWMKPFDSLILKKLKLIISLNTPLKKLFPLAQAKDKSYEDLYKKLDSKEGTNDIYKIAKPRERMDIGNI